MRASINGDSVTLNAILQNTVKRVQLIKERQYYSVYSSVNTHVGKNTVSGVARICCEEGQSWRLSWSSEHSWWT